MIYFVQAEGGGPIKIGCSDDVPRRIRQLELHYGQTMIFLAMMEGGPDEEKIMHERFSHLQLGRSIDRGLPPELFHPGPDLMEFIRAIPSISRERLEIGARIKAERIRLGLTLAECSRRMGMGRHAYMSLEKTATPPPSRLHEIASRCGFDLRAIAPELLGD